MKKWTKLLLMLCLVLGMTFTVHAEDNMTTDDLQQEETENTDVTDQEKDDQEEPDSSEEEEEVQNLQAPQISTTQTAKGVRVYWELVEGATKYEVYRKSADGTWGEKPYFTSKTGNYVNTTLEYGATYSYKVKAVNEETGQESDFSNIKTRTVKVAKLENLKVDRDTYSTVKLTWTKSSPATGYEVYRATSASGTYKKVKTITKNTTTSYVDKGLTIGKTYYYKVRAVYEKAKGSYCTAVSRKVALLPPVMKSTSYATKTSIQVSWEPSPSAQGYYVYRKTSSGSWKQIAKVTGATKDTYTDKTAKGVYQYSVRSYRKVNGKIHTSNRAYSIQARVLDVPTFKVGQVDGEKVVKISWNKVANATMYAIYQGKSSKGDWKCLEEVSGDTLSYKVTMPTEKTIYWKIRPIYIKGDYKVYGPETGTKSQRIYLPKFITHLDMDYSAMPSKENAESILLGVVNIGKGAMRIYSADAYYNAGAENSRKMHLADVDSGKAKNYIDVAINSGTIEESDIALPLFIIDGSATSFDMNSELQFTFRYDGLYYKAFVKYGNVSFKAIEKP